MIVRSLVVIVNCLAFLDSQEFLEDGNLPYLDDDDNPNTIEMPKCTFSVCEGRGRCFINSALEPECKCYKQYYKGDFCKKTPDPCDMNNEFVPHCEKSGTQKCFPYFGNNYCLCKTPAEGKPPIEGRLCQFTNTEPTGHYALYAGIYSNLQPIHFQQHSVFIVCQEFYQTVKFRAIIEGLVFDYEPKNFKVGSIYSLLSREINFLPSDHGLIMQTKVIERRHTFLKRGMNSFILTQFKKNDHGGADWLFQYDVQPASGKCVPSVSFSGGACGTNALLAPSFLYKRLYKVQIYIAAGCNESNSHVIKKTTVDKYELGKEYNVIEKISSTHEAKRPVFTISDWKPTCKNQHGMIYIYMMKVGETVGPISRMTPQDGIGICFIQYLVMKKLVLHILGGGYMGIPSEFGKVDLKAQVNEEGDPYTTITENINIKWKCRVKTCPDQSRYYNEKTSVCGCNYTYGDLGTGWELKPIYLKTDVGDVNKKIFAKFDVLVQGFIGKEVFQSKTLEVTVVHESKYEVLLVQCVKNCGAGHSDNQLRIDMDEFIHIQVICMFYCSKFKTVNWNLRGLRTDPPSHFVSILGRSQSYKNAAAKNKINWILAYTRSPELKAGWPIKIQEVPSYSHNNLCNRITYERKSTELFKICLAKSDPYLPVNILIFQKLSFINTLHGVLIGFGKQVLYENNWLAPNNIPTPINFWVLGELSEAAYWAQSEKKYMVNPPDVRTGDRRLHLDLIKKITQGDWEDTASIKFDAQQQHFIPLAQKINMLNVEMTYVGLDLKDLELSIFLHSETMDWFKTTFNDLTVIRSYDVIEEVMIMISMILHMLYITDWPVPFVTACGTSTLYETAVKATSKLLETDRLYKDKPWRVVDLVIMPMLHIATAYTKHGAGISSTAIDFKEKQLNQSTSDEIISLESGYEDYEPYDVQDFSSFEIVRCYSKGTTSAMDMTLELLDILTKTLIPSIRHRKTEKQFFYPAVEFSTGVFYNDFESNDMFVYTKVDTTKAFARKIKYVKAFNEKAHLNLPVELLTAFGGNNDTAIAVQFAVFESAQHWWSPSTLGLLPTAVVVKIKEFNHPNLADFGAFKQTKPTDMVSLNEKDVEVTLSFSTTDMERQFLSTIAWQINDADYLIAHLAKIKPGTAEVLLVMFDSQIEGNLMVAITVNRAPIFGDFELQKLFVGKNSQNFQFSRKLNIDVGTTNMVYVSVLPTEREKVPYKISMFMIDCLGWNEGPNHEQSHWQSSCKDLKIDKNQFLKCKCSTMTNKVYGAKMVQLKPQIYGILSVEMDFQMVVSLVIPFVTFLILMGYFLLLILAKFADQRNEHKRSPVFILTNRENDYYLYVIIVETGGLWHAGTTSHVGIKVYGTHDNSARHVLWGFTRTPLFQKRAIDFFAVMTPGPLGCIRAVELWIDYRGCRPSWYCEKVIVRDYNRLVEWVFIVRKLFSLDPKHPLRQFIYQKIVKDCLQCCVLEDFFVHHIWFGMFVREHCHSFNRKVKVSSAFSIIVVAAWIILIREGIVFLDNHAVLDQGHFHMDWLISDAIFGLLGAIIIVYPIMYTIKNSNPDPAYNYYYNDFSGTDPAAPIPLYLFNYNTMVIAWILLILIDSIAVITLVMFGFSYGVRKSAMWVVALTFVILLDVLIFETIHVVFRGWIWRWYMRRCDTHRFCNEILNIYVDYGEKIDFARINKHKYIYRDMLQPVERCVRKKLKLKEKTFLPIETNLKNFGMYSIYLILLVLFMKCFQDEYTFYATNILTQIFWDGIWTNGIPFKHITNLNQFYDFLNFTLIFGTQWQQPNLLVMVNYKLLGVVRLRMHRIDASEELRYMPEEFEKVHVIRYSSNEYSPENIDRGNYNPKWLPFNKTHTKKSWKFTEPFWYQPDDFTDSFDIAISGHPTILGGGFSAYLGRSLSNSKQLLNYLAYKGEWITRQTRIIVIELVTYNPHANLFSNVKLIALFTTTGDIVTRKQISSFRIFQQTFKEIAARFFLHVLVNVVAFFGILSILFELKQKTCRHAFTQLHTYIDIIIMINGVLLFFYFIYREIYGFILVSNIQDSRLARFVNFDRMDHLDYVCRIIASTLIFLSVIRMTRLLLYFRYIRVIGLTIRQSLSTLLEAAGLFLILLSAITLGLYFWMGPWLYVLHVFKISFMIALSHPFAPHERIEEPIFERGRFTALLFLIWAAFCFRIMMYSFFQIIIVAGWKKARQQIRTSSRQNYGLYDYIRERILCEPSLLDASRKHHRTCYSQRESIEEIVSPELVQESSEIVSEFEVWPGPSYRRDKDWDICEQYQKDFSAGRETKLYFDADYEQSTSVKRVRTRIRLCVEKLKQEEQRELNKSEENVQQEEDTKEVNEKQGSETLPENDSKENTKKKKSDKKEK